MEKTVDIGGSLSFALDKLKEQTGLLLGIGGLIFVLFLAQNGLQWAFSESLLSPLIGLAFNILFIYLYTGIFQVMLRVVDGERPPFGDIFGGGSKFLPYLAVSVLLGIMTFVGAIFLIIPGLIVATIFLFAPAVLLDENTGILESFSRAAELSRGARLMLFVFMIVIGLIGLAGALFFGIGMIVTIPLTLVAYMWQLRNLQHQTGALPAAT